MVISTYQGFSIYNDDDRPLKSNCEASKKKIITLMVTGNCNLRCTYCYQKGYNEKRQMSFEVARKFIDNFFSSLEDETLCGIEFIGGEPLLAIGLLSEITEYVNRKYFNNRYSFNITTNGTINNKQVKEWILANKEKLYISVSIDGDKEAHDKNRCGSYDKAISFLNYLISIGMSNNIGIKMTIGPDSIGSIFKGICELHKLGVKIFSNVVFENVWGDGEEKAKLVAVFREELAKLVEFYSENRELLHNSLVSIPLPLLGLEKSQVRKWCGSGDIMSAVDMDGKLYSCHREITEKFDSLNATQLNTETATNKCSSCVFANACPHCEIFNMSESRSKTNRTNYHCEFIKAQIIATARLAYNNLKNKLNSPKKCTNEELKWIRGILFVNDHISSLI